MNKLVNIRLEDKVLKKIDSTVKESLFSTRTEFIKSAIIKALEEYETHKAIKELRKHFGEGKRLGIKGPTNKEFEKIREAVGKRSLKEVGLV